MKKANIKWIILDSIFLIIFNAFFFVLGGVDRTLSVWISYGFIHAAYFMLIVTTFLLRRSKNIAVFGFSLYFISSVYFVVQLIVGIVFIVVASENYTASLLVQLLVAGLYATLLVSHMIANEHTAVVEEKRQHEIDYVKGASAQLSTIMALAGASHVRKRIEKVYDAVNTSPTKSHPSVCEIESQIIREVVMLRVALEEDKHEVTMQKCATLLTLINERNARLRKIHQ